MQRDKLSWKSGIVASQEVLATASSCAKMEISFRNNGTLLGGSRTALSILFGIILSGAIVSPGLGQVPDSISLRDDAGKIVVDICSDPDPKPRLQQLLDGTAQWQALLKDAIAKGAGRAEIKRIRVGLLAVLAIRLAVNDCLGLKSDIPATVAGAWSCGDSHGVFLLILKSDTLRASSGGPVTGTYQNGDTKYSVAGTWARDGSASGTAQGDQGAVAWSGMIVVGPAGGEWTGQGRLHFASSADASQNCDGEWASTRRPP